MRLIGANARRDSQETNVSMRVATVVTIMVVALAVMSANVDVASKGMTALLWSVDTCQALMPALDMVTVLEVSANVATGGAVPTVSCFYAMANRRWRERAQAMDCVLESTRVSV